ncbi:hypothetical protein CEXT_390821 [Caerostris extrusa]|uniref:Uncharacterized protein n=1 Tax=Caerostris extrusa TaxID=172846 RepID=A0AAV4NPK7_CAEEX|nr:hypothetical protein CEXT_390821 [Caerostris extrusa]
MLKRQKIDCRMIYRGGATTNELGGRVCVEGEGGGECSFPFQTALQGLRMLRRQKIDCRVIYRGGRNNERFGGCACVKGMIDGSPCVCSKVMEH